VYIINNELSYFLCFLMIALCLISDGAFLHIMHARKKLTGGERQTDARKKNKKQQI
jgi:hypothetical protein